MTVVNAGTIAGGSASGIRLGGGSVTNQSGGTIKDASANAPAIGGYGALTVTNAGTIDGGTVNAVQLAAGVTNRLVVDPGAVFVGGVDGGNTIGAASVSTMELAGRSAGTLSGVGTQFVDFVQTTVDTGASWTLTGGITLAAGTTLTDAGTLTVTDTTINDGSIRIDPSTATFGTLIGTGTVAISGGSTLDVLGSVAAGETIDFGAGSNLLGINPTEFAAQIDGFVAGDTIELTGVTDGISAAIVNGNTLQIERTAHPAVELKLDPTVNYTGNNYAVGSDGAVTEAAPCFLRGTLVRTERGEVAVQDLAIGERVLTLSGQIRPIMWIGTGHVVVCRGHRSAATPVIVRKSAFTDQVPDRDLRVTKGHSFYFDGVLVPIEYLVNHRSILWDDRAQEVELYHLELESHDVLLANGAPAESYRDDGNRWLFQNGTGALPQHNQEPCAPVLTGGPVVDALWRRLLERAGPTRQPAADGRCRRASGGEWQAAGCVRAAGGCACVPAERAATHGTHPLTRGGAPGARAGARSAFARGGDPTDRVGAGAASECNRGGRGVAVGWIPCVRGADRYPLDQWRCCCPGGAVCRHERTRPADAAVWCHDAISRRGRRLPSCVAAAISNEVRTRPVSRRHRRHLAPARDQGTLVRPTPHGELRRHLLRHVAPLANGLLTKQPHGRIPRCIATLQQPAPVGRARQHDPHRPAHRARQGARRMYLR